MKWQSEKQQKLVQFLQKKLGSVSKKQIRRLLEANLCKVNHRIERFGSSTLDSSDVVELADDWKNALFSLPPSFELLYENCFFKIVNKPFGWVCDPKSASETFGKEWNLVHRLDKDTTGALLLGKGRQVSEELMELFALRQVEKSYLAIVDGKVKEESGVKKSYLAKKRTYEGQTIWGSSPKGLLAITEWQRLFAKEKATLLLCRPITGRTHQLRVHFAEMGHPILLDRQYAKNFRCSFFFSRPLLHAHRLQFCFRNEKIDVLAPLFGDMEQALNQLELSATRLDLFCKKEHGDGRQKSESDKNGKEMKGPSHLFHPTCH